MEWISIKDKSPESGEWVIVCTALNDLYYAKFTRSMWGGDYDVLSDHYSSRGRNTITHWISKKDFPFPNKI
jgi:hypothetical protein